jgi:polyphosphate kinase 2 (PPK2 family)
MLSIPIDSRAHNELILPLDPRGFTVHSASGPTEEEAFYPFLWRFWKRTPTRGRLAIFDRSWNRRVLTAGRGAGQRETTPAGV